MKCVARWAELRTASSPVAHATGNSCTALRAMIASSLNFTNKIDVPRRYWQGADEHGGVREPEHARKFQACRKAREKSLISSGLNALTERGMLIKVDLHISLVVCGGAGEI